MWRQVNGPHKDQLGWIPAGGVVTATAGGVYTLAPLEMSPAAAGLPVLLRVPRPTTGGDYYVSFRRRIGYDSNMRLDYADRASIHTRPSTNTLLVGLLSDGQTFADPTNGLVITQASHDTTAVRIAVSTTSTCGKRARMTAICRACDFPTRCVSGVRQISSREYRSRSWRYSLI